MESFSIYKFNDKNILLSDVVSFTDVKELRTRTRILAFDDIEENRSIRKSELEVTKNHDRISYQGFEIEMSNGNVIEVGDYLTDAESLFHIKNLYDEFVCMLNKYKQTTNVSFKLNPNKYEKLIKEFSNTTFILDYKNTENSDFYICKETHISLTKGVTTFVENCIYHKNSIQEFGNKFNKVKLVIEKSFFCYDNFLDKLHIYIESLEDELEYLNFYNIAIIENLPISLKLIKNE